MKKIGIFLATVFILTIFSPSFDAEAQTDTDTYIIKLDSSGEQRAEELGLTEINADEGLYLARKNEINKLSKDIEYCEENIEVYLLGDTTERGVNAELMSLTNDKFSGRQWSLPNIGINRAWNEGYYGNGVKIAVIDSGVRASHEDLQSANIAEGYNMFNGSSDVIDETGHGTFITGMLAASIDNGKGIAGMTPNVTIVPIKCFRAGGKTDASYIVSAVYKAVDTYECDIINLSLGLTVDLQSLKQAIEYATDKGVIVVAAAGNAGNTSISYPAAYSNVIGVGSIDSSGTISSFSQRNSSVNVVAPGSDLISTSNSDDTNYSKGKGTSFATPHVAAAAAILKQYSPAASFDDFSNLLISSSTDLGSPGYDTTYGYGSLNVGVMVSEMKRYDRADGPIEPKNASTSSLSDNNTEDKHSAEGSEIMSRFTDLCGHWAEADISYCVSRKYFVGMSDTEFGPEHTMTRGMFITVLSRMSGEVLDGYESVFNDISDDKYYSEACAWALYKGIIKGDSSGNFYPETNITREQMATFLYKYAVAYGYAEGSQNLNLISSYDDYADVSSGATEPFAWAVKNAIINGRTYETLCPNDTAKRSEVSAIFYRFSSQHES